MRAKNEIKRLQNKLDDGTLDPEEPLFVLRAKDRTAANHVRKWVAMAKALGCPENRLQEALALAELMDTWPIKQIPGRPQTLQDTRKKC